MTHKNRATLIGFIAILLWSSLVGTIRIVCENLGAHGGVATIYSVATVIIFFTVGMTKIQDFPIRYLIWGTLFFVSYELCFSLSIGFANNGRQAVEVSMLNYLWPTFTILFAIIFNQQKANFLIIPGSILPLIGIGWVLGGEQGLDIISMYNNINNNPLSYGLAFIGSIIWASYCMITVRLAEGKNGITLFLFCTSIVMWIQYWLSSEATLSFNSLTLIFYIGLAAFAIGVGYAAWNYGVYYGNVTILAGASYFIPIISASLSAILLNLSLTFSFWQGTGLVCLGALLCWFATRTIKQSIKEINNES